MEECLEHIDLICILYHHTLNSMTKESDSTYSLLKTLKTPSAVSSLAFGHAGHLFVGTGIQSELSSKWGTFIFTFPSDDGILRVYDLSTFKVLKAIKNLGFEVSSIVCVKKRGSDLRDAWVASGTKVRPITEH